MIHFFNRAGQLLLSVCYDFALNFPDAVTAAIRETGNSIKSVDIETESEC